MTYPRQPGFVNERNLLPSRSARLQLRAAKRVSAALIAVAFAAGCAIWQSGAAAAPRLSDRDHRTVELAAQTTQWKVFHDPKNGIEFSYPDNMRIVGGCLDEKNCVAMVGQTARPDDYLLAFEVFDGSLETVAVDQAVFQKEGDHWVAKGRNATHPAETISGPGWRGLKAIVDCGVSDSAGFHGGAGECLWVVMSDGKRSVVADTQGTAPINQELLRSIESLRFIPH